MSRRPSLFEVIYAAVTRIPRGRVSTYGRVAALIGLARGARTVGWALHGNPYGRAVPCHRVVHKDGGLTDSFRGGKAGHRRLLEAEGVTFRPDGTVDMSRHVWPEGSRGSRPDTAHPTERTPWKST